MKPREQEYNFQNKLTDSIQFVGLHTMPQDFLPEPVTVVEAIEDPDGIERPNLLHCILKEICDDRTCYMSVVGSDEEDIYGLGEIVNISLINLWEKYVRTSENVWKDNAIAYLKENTDASEDIVKAFVETQWNREELFADNLESFNHLANNQIEEETWVFTYSIDRFDRDASDEEIIADYERGNDDEPTRKMTVERFAALINDEMFDNIHNWVRIIKLPKNK